MICILPLAATALGIAVIVAVVDLVEHYCDATDENAPLITYKQLQRWVAIAPHRWSKNRGFIYHTGKEHGSIRVRFSFWDYWRAVRLLDKMEKREMLSLQHKANSHNARLLLEDIQHDIDVMQAKANIELTRTGHILDDIKRGIKQF